MHTYSSYLWHKLHLHGHKKRLVVVLFLVAGWMMAQIPPPQKSYMRFKKKYEVNLPNYDEKLLHYGFFLAVNYNRLNINVSEDYLKESTFSAVTPSATMGFCLGFLLNVRLADQLSFKVLPSVGFYDRDLRFSYALPGGDLTDGNDLQDVKKIETTFIETSFLMKYKSIRRANHRFYMVGGFKPSVRAGGKKPDGSNKNMGFGSIDVALEYGAGVDFYFQFFKWAPELRFSHGLLNMNTGDQNDFNRSLSSMFTHTVTLYFFFE